MLLRKKLCAALIVAVLFLMLASHSIQRGRFLPLTLTLPIIRVTPTNWERAEATTPHVDLTPIPPSAAPPPRMLEPESEEDPGEEAQHQLRTCACVQSCISDLGGSDWFQQRYDQTQQPVLRSNSIMDPEALRWWMHLQRSGNDRTLEEVMAEMFKVVPSPTVDFRPLASRCRTCAVVGNSGRLRQSGHGKSIDSHDSVIRMNKAVTRGFAKDVGNRTTHHFLYPESAVDVERGVSLVLLPFKLRDVEWLTSALSTGKVKMTYMRVKERVAADRNKFFFSQVEEFKHLGVSFTSEGRREQEMDRRVGAASAVMWTLHWSMVVKRELSQKVLVVNPVFFKYVNDLWTEHHGRYPSTGMLAIIFALHICDQVSVFGYGADEQGNWHHYWEQNRYAGAFRKTGVHSAEFETQIIHKLAKEGKIRLYL